MFRQVISWSGRFLLLLGLVSCACLTVLCAIATITEATGDEAETFSDLPPIYVITGILVPVFAVLAYGCWWWLVDTFRGPEEDPR